MMQALAAKFANFLKDFVKCGFAVYLLLCELLVQIVIKNEICSCENVHKFWHSAVYGCHIDIA